MNLVSVFRMLRRPGAVGEVAFSAEPIEGWPRYRVACDALSRPALLIDTGAAEGHVRLNTELRYVSLWPAARCEVASKGLVTNEIFSIIKCKSDDEALQEIFLEILGNLIEALGPEPSSVAVSASFEHLAQLFEALTKASTAELKGLWGELLLIAASSNPALLAVAWHAYRSELHDFQSGQQLVEVKTTSVRPRRHEVSLAQLSPPAGSSLILVSVLVEETRPIVSLKALMAIAKRRLVDPKLRLRLDEIVANTLGTDWPCAGDVAFNARRAVSDLRFIAAARVPCVDRALPPEVSDVRFKVELDGVEGAVGEDLRESGGLHAALVPDERAFLSETNIN